MIVTMPNTTTAAISHEIDELHVERGEAALGRVLTLIITTQQSQMEEALATVNAASREHPCRVIAIITDADAIENGHIDTMDPDGNRVIKSDKPSKKTLDAQIRFGADAGAGEIIILAPVAALLDHLDTLVIPLLVPDAPVVTWWPSQAPINPSGNALGSKSMRRITDAQNSPDPATTFSNLRKHIKPADIDLSWTRITIWRAMLASLVAQPPHLPITAVSVSGQSDYLPLELLASWLALKLQLPVTVDRSPKAQAITGVYFERADGKLGIDRLEGDHAVIHQPGQTDQTVSLPLRSLNDCLNEELGRIDPDEVYADVVAQGWDLVSHN